MSAPSITNSTSLPIFLAKSLTILGNLLKTSAIGVSLISIISSCNSVRSLDNVERASNNSLSPSLSPICSSLPFVMTSSPTRFISLSKCPTSILITLEILTFGVSIIGGFLGCLGGCFFASFFSSFFSSSFSVIVKFKTSGCFFKISLIFSLLSLVLRTTSKNLFSMRFPSSISCLLGFVDKISPIFSRSLRIRYDLGPFKGVSGWKYTLTTYSLPSTAFSPASSFFFSSTISTDSTSGCLLMTVSSSSLGVSLTILNSTTSPSRLPFSMISLPGFVQITSPLSSRSESIRKALTPFKGASFWNLTFI
ncbi:307aa long hypothetical protein [Pyrococcus horikoshii OT3]|uniref:Uncharacterized protein n=1 Tax=Pyrococcus horikoshii (strain ATCC 700860 / DSM 12428 / JCM 9974 / NBRC 100139 / OT-3) TaxID=70601 RepID=O58191_PYRHO|nr:307aa long hypothetical protein [Pyrococcus horikoshii OT3]